MSTDAGQPSTSMFGVSASLPFVTFAVSPKHITSPSNVFSTRTDTPAALVNEHTSRDTLVMPDASTRPPVSGFVSSVTTPNLVRVPPRSGIAPLPAGAVNTSSLTTYVSSLFLTTFLLTTLINDLSTGTLEPPIAFTLLEMSLPILTLGFSLP